MKVLIAILIIAVLAGIASLRPWRQARASLLPPDMAVSEWDVLIGADARDNASFQVCPFDQTNGIVIDCRLLSPRYDRTISALGGKVALAWMDESAYQQLVASQKDTDVALSPALLRADAEGLVHHLLLVPRDKIAAGMLTPLPPPGSRFTLQGHKMALWRATLDGQPISNTAAGRATFYLVSVLRYH